MRFPGAGALESTGATRESCCFLLASADAAGANGRVCDCCAAIAIVFLISSIFCVAKELACWDWVGAAAAMACCLAWDAIICDK